MLTDDELAAIAEIPLHGDVPRLVAEIRALRAERETLREQLRSEQDRLCGYLTDLRAELDEARAALIATTPPPGAVVALVRATLDQVLSHNGHSAPSLKREHLLGAERYLTVLADVVDALPVGQHGEDARLRAAPAGVGALQFLQSDRGRLENDP